MKNIINRNVICFFALLLTVSGCKKIDEDFLKTTPETFYTVDNIFSTSAQVDQAVVAIYSQLRDIWANPTEQNWIFVFRAMVPTCLMFQVSGEQTLLTTMAPSMPAMQISTVLMVPGTRLLRKLIWQFIVRRYPI